MAFQLSPGVNVSEIDLTNVVPGVSSSIGAFAGQFSWGPANKRILVDSENTLVKVFGKPTDTNFTDFFSVANFLAYTNNIKVVRAIDNANTVNATAIKEFIDLSTLTASKIIGTKDIVFSDADVARYVTAGDTITVGGTSYVANSVSSNTVTVVTGAVWPAYANNLTVSLASSSTTVSIANEEDYEINFPVGSVSKLGSFVARYPGDLGNSLTISVCSSNTAFASWDYASYFDSAPSESLNANKFGALSDELHIIVIDTDGKFSGEKGTILEKFAHVSKASDATTDDGSPNYYVTKVFNESKYIYVLNHLFGSTNWGSSLTNTTFDKLLNYTVKLSGGVNAAPSTSDIVSGYDLFANADEVDISLIVTGAANATVANKALTLSDQRKDCVAFISPLRVNAVDNVDYNAIITYKDSLSPLNSYGIFDSGWKYQFDKYNNKYRYVPLNADIAGLCARTDNIRDPWWSPAGFNRGQILNAIKLSWNPNKAQRDELYKKNINPVCAFPGEGIVLYGDKTLQAKPSAFDRINVRRLFIVLEKAIATAAKYSLFEFNDQFTRAQFVAMVEPFLRDVKGRRGIYDYRVICDETNNTPEVIDTNRFVGDIYIKPARSINFIQLNFVAVRTGVDFTEVAGKF